jgi:hypothetical protein
VTDDRPFQEFRDLGYARARMKSFVKSCHHPSCVSASQPKADRGEPSAGRPLASVGSHKGTWRRYRVEAGTGVLGRGLLDGVGALVRVRS